MGGPIIREVIRFPRHVATGQQAVDRLKRSQRWPSMMSCRRDAFGPQRRRRLNALKKCQLGVLEEQRSGKRRHHPEIELSRAKTFPGYARVQPSSIIVDPKGKSSNVA